MVNQRQREARKRFRAEHPELVRKPKPTPPKDPIMKKEQHRFLGMRPTNKVHGKHPLRVLGMRPGESCFICKAAGHIAKLCPQKSQREKNKICLLCRRHGHSMKNCPNKNNSTMDRKLCYNCGDTEHSLYNCPKPLEDGGTKFATCFICKQSGHLSKNCPKNARGIYPKGGSCNICGGITHLAKDCPNKSNRDSVAAGKAFQSWKEDERPRGKVTKFVSGDDLEDDFSFIDEKAADIVGSSSQPQESNVKSKKHGPKVVNFVG